MSIIPPPASAALHLVSVDSGIQPSQFQDPDAPKRKKKKRRREEEHEAEDAGGLREKKKKKKKRHHTEQEAVQEESVVDPPQVQLADTVPVKHKKSKKRDKGKQRESPQPEIDPTLASNTQASAAALISAIVAAATGAPDNSIPVEEAQPPPLEPQFDPTMVPHPSQHFMPYPFMPYGYGAPPYMPPHAMSPTFFPTQTNLPFSELNFASNDDVLRALQALDMSKITNVLKTLGEAAATANEPAGSAMQQLLTPLGQVPVGSGAILGLPSEGQGPPAHHRRTIDMSLPGTEHHTSPDHAYLLANKWLNAAKLADLVKTEGLVYKKGKFSAIEEQQIQTAMENYRIMKGLAEEQMMELIYPTSEKNRDNAFWSELTSAVPQRPIIAVYHHVRRLHHPLQKLGKWSSQEDAALVQAVTDLGQQWEKVSTRVGRRSADCRDRYRNHMVNRDVRVTGPWSKAEEEELTRIVTDIKIKQGLDTDNEVFWGRVSELMGGKRGRQQCRIKWTDALSKTIKNEGQKPRWSQQDAYILVHKVDSLNVRDDTEIDWKTIADPQWNLWSAHTLQRRWLTMKRGIKGFEDMTHQEIMDILRLKKAHMPMPPPVVTKKRKERKVTSAASVVEDGPISAPAPAGSSTGRGTLAGTVVSKAVVEDSDSDSSSSDSD
ncbi:nucleolar protein [Lyophyllum atratum]|nr:nucleolar protein [Lyophyllum atratum]